MKYIIYKGKKIDVEERVLDSGDKGIEDISEIIGLEFLTDLRVLKLNNNKIMEIKGLDTLINLEELYLSNNQITEIKGLETLRNLRKLYLEYNHISEIEGIEHLNKLQILNLAGNENINELKGLENLINLQELYLGIYGEEGFNRIEEIKGLENLSNLKILDLSNNMVSKINLKKQKKLKVLYLQDNEIYKIPDGLENLTNLESLFLDMNSISEIEGLENLINLEYLNLESKYITKIKGIEKLEKLVQIIVNLDENLIKKIRLKQKLLPKRFEGKNFAQILVEYCKIKIEDEIETKINEQRQKEIFEIKLKELVDKENDKAAEYFEKAYQKLLEMDGSKAQKELFEKLVQKLEGKIGFMLGKGQLEPLNLDTKPIKMETKEFNGWFDYDNFQKGEVNHFDEKNILRKVLIKCYEKLVEFDLNNCYYWHELGLSYECIGNKRKAIQAYNKFLELAPWDIKEQYKWRWKGFGDLYKIQGLYERALEFYKKSLDYYKKNHAIRKVNIIKFKIAEIYELQGNFEKALIFEEIIPLIEKNDPYYNLIINFFKELRYKTVVPQWIEILPFPLASILWLYISDANVEHKIDHLFHFFEATAEILVMFMLSSFYLDKEFYKQEKYRWVEKDPKYQDWYKIPTFSNWIFFGRRLSKALRIYLNDKKSKVEYLNRFRLSDLFCSMLSNKKLYAILEKVANWRNIWKGHGGISNTEELKKRVSILEKLLEEIKDIFDRYYDNILIIKPRTMQLRGGTYYHHLECVMGTRSPFRIMEIELTEPLDGEKLYLLDLNSNTRLAIELLPFIRIMGSPKDEKNACYFYNRVIGGNIRWVSYHFAKEAEKIIPDDQIIHIFSLLQEEGN